ncbi:hypothetical protein A4U61_08465 [Streptomyces sp. H-KF8]|uniref:hypothetical protein n=1 Tax=Streptomyces sp. H-KF8 TaxID=1727216 RepID=UPI0007EDA731|nr:hypothetical protein [Streptomyces sp. H-KF8]OBQ51681.1 hypothetical protein A4U61_08465 [Streptomyces sp. H-KF8]
MDPGTAWAALSEAVAAPAACAVVADVDWGRFHPAYTLARHRPLFDDLPQVRQLSATPASRHRTRARAPASPVRTGTGRRSTWSVRRPPPCSGTPAPRP